MEGKRKVIKKEHHKHATKNVKEKRRIKKLKKERRMHMTELTFGEK